jgi:sugar phosphate isomerase/epimerase
MLKEVNRREFLKSSAILPTIAVAGMSIVGDKTFSQKKMERIGGSSLKVSCCAYSFRDYLTKGKMNLEGFLELCANLGFDGVEVTSYYFPGYPNRPDDAYIYKLKKKAMLLGLDVSGTSASNDFCNPDKARRAKDIENVKMWVECGSKLGAPEIRVFGGNGIPKEHTEEEVTEWVAEALKECADYGEKYGVMIALENHGGFPDKAEQVLRLLKMVNSEWIGANLDTGGFGRSEAPYKEIATVAPYAITCHVKVNIGKEPVDMNRVVKILRDANYRGYLPIEYEEKEDPMTGVPAFLKEIKKAIG